ncbi:hypothetical protein Tco_0057432 [Tanacetum coccineum]
MSLKWAHKSNGDTVNNRSDDANIFSTAIESFTKVEHIEDEEMEFTCHLDQIPLVCDFHLKRFDREEWSLASEAFVRISQKSQENSQKRANTDTRIRRVQKEAKVPKP